jgi:GTP-binding protein Era
MGIVSGDDYQIVFSDTPGILKPGYALQEYMRKSARSALTDSDILLFVTDVSLECKADREFLDRIRRAEFPVLVVINKIDLSNAGRLGQLEQNWMQLLPAAEIFPVSAREKFNLDRLLARIIDLLPESPAYYPRDAFTDKSERFFAAEILREKILLNYRREIPYSVEIEVESFKEEDNIIRIRNIK